MQRIVQAISDPQASALAKIAELQKVGTSNQDCLGLAGDTITNIESELKGHQGTLDALKTGDQCEATAEAEADVPASLVDLDATTEAYNAATQAVTSARAATMATWGASVMDLLKQKSFSEIPGADEVTVASWIKSAPSYNNQQGEVSNKEETQKSKELKQVDAKGAHDANVATAEKLKERCLCNAKTARNAAQQKADKFTSSSTHSWEEAHHMKCALDGRPKDECDVPALTSTAKVLFPQLDLAAVRLCCRSQIG